MCTYYRDYHSGNRIYAGPSTPAGSLTDGLNPDGDAAWAADPYAARYGEHPYALRTRRLAGTRAAGPSGRTNSAGGVDVQPFFGDRQPDAQVQREDGPTPGGEEVEVRSDEPATHKLIGVDWHADEAPFDRNIQLPNGEVTVRYWCSKAYERINQSGMGYRNTHYIGYTDEIFNEASYCAECKQWFRINLNITLTEGRAKP